MTCMVIERILCLLSAISTGHLPQIVLYLSTAEREFKQPLIKVCILDYMASMRSLVKVGNWQSLAGLIMYTLVHC